MRRCVALSLAALFWAVAPSSPAAREYEIKAAFIYNFVGFVTWPETAFVSRRAPLRIGVVGTDPFEKELEQLFAGKLINGRQVDVVHYRNLHGLAEIERLPHVLYFAPGFDDSTLAKELESLCGMPVLTVGDSPDFAQNGGIVNFYEDKKKVRFEVNRACESRGGLELSSRLLSLARIVGTRK